MAKLPPKTPKSECPGCKNRYDDFVATHIKQTFSVRLTVHMMKM
jgi:tyrosinase